MQARRKLGLALEALEANVMARLNEAEQLAASASASDSESAEQWQNACHMLEEQLTALKEENSQLHSELHQTREALHQAEERAADL
jgi:septal ring factor EnvC (AmiA/AmiB activator)